jgi:hypothetical protein
VYNTFLVKKNLYRLILNLEKNPIYEKLLCLKNKKDNVVLELPFQGIERKEIFKLLMENSYNHFQKIEKNYPMINPRKKSPKIPIFIFMQLVRWLPKFLYRHKILDFICKFGWQDCVIPVRYNSNARTVIDLRDPEPRNVFIQKQFEPDFFDLANSFIGEKGTFFDFGRQCRVLLIWFDSIQSKNRVPLIRSKPEHNSSSQEIG